MRRSNTEFSGLPSGISLAVEVNTGPAIETQKVFWRHGKASAVTEAGIKAGQPQLERKAPLK